MTKEEVSAIAGSQGSESMRRTAMMSEGSLCGLLTLSKT